MVCRESFSRDRACFVETLATRVAQPWSYRRPRCCSLACRCTPSGSEYKTARVSTDGFHVAHCPGCVILFVPAKTGCLLSQNDCAKTHFTAARAVMVSQQVDLVAGVNQAMARKSGAHVYTLAASGIFTPFGAWRTVCGVARRVRLPQATQHSTWIPLRWTSQPVTAL